MEGESQASRSCHRREGARSIGERAGSSQVLGSGYSFGSVRHSHTLIASSLLAAASGSRDLSSLTGERALSNESMLSFPVATLPSHLDYEPLREVGWGAEATPHHSASAHGARNRAWLCSCSSRCAVDNEAKSNILLMEVFYIFHV